MRFLLRYFILHFQRYHICGSLISNYQLPRSEEKAESESNRLSPSLRVRHWEMMTSCVTNRGVLGLHKDNLTFSTSAVSAEVCLSSRFFSDVTLLTGQSVCDVSKERSAFEMSVTVDQSTRRNIPED
jgi:hypothetical protein